jgi:dTMP kinase
LRLNDWILHLEYEVNKIPRPDVSLFLDVPFSFTKSRLTEQREGDDRSYLNGATDIHEQSLSLQERVREVYIESAERDSELVVVDCSNDEGAMASPEEIISRIEATISPLLK